MTSSASELYSPLETQSVLDTAVTFLLILKQHSAEWAGDSSTTHSWFCMGYLMRSRSSDFWNIVSPITVFLSPLPYFFFEITFPRWSSLVTLQSAVCGLRIKKDKDRKWFQILVNTQNFCGPIPSAYMTSLLTGPWTGTLRKNYNHPALKKFITKFNNNIFRIWIWLFATHWSWGNIRNNLWLLACLIPNLNKSSCIGKFSWKFNNFHF